MKTKSQKNQLIKETQELLDNSQNLTFVDFSGVSVNDMKNLRQTLKDLGAKTKIVKKKLLRVALEKKGVDFNPEQFDLQLATIFSSNEITDIASPIYKFFKEQEKKGFKILGSYNLSEKMFSDAEMVKKIGQLPPREILLAQLVGMLSAPIKMFMYLLSEKSKQTQ